MKLNYADDGDDDDDDDENLLNYWPSTKFYAADLQAQKCTP